MEHLSGMDASFLHLETPETPMHVGSLMLFDLPEGYAGDFYEDVKAMLAKRLHLASVLHRKLAQMPFELANPVWIEDNDLDLDHHIRSVTLRRPGTLDQLEQLVARLHSTLLDRSRPLWEMYVIDGLENGQVAFYSKAHHSGVDGKAGVEMAKVLYDTSPVIREVPPPRRKHGSGDYQLGFAELLEAAVTNTAQQYIKAAQLLPTALKAMNAANSVLSSRASAEGTRPLELGLAPKTIFNASITNQRSYRTMSVPMSEMKALGARKGGTINTVVMAMCSGALRRFLKERSLLPKQSLIALVPLSLRADTDDSMNNQVSTIRVDLATEIEDPTERFSAIHASSEAGKELARELKPVLGVDLPVTGSPWLMTGIASLVGRADLASRLPSAAGSVLISNVPGPPKTLYMAGARLVHYYPVSIPYHGSALNITVQSYDGNLEFGITACRRALSHAEVGELIGHLHDAMREIEEVADSEPGESKNVRAPAGLSTHSVQASKSPRERKRGSGSRRDT